jgi:hypothetical protein
MWRRAPDAGEDYAALAKSLPTPPATAAVVFDGDEGRLSEEAFLHDFAGDLPEAKARVHYAVQEQFHKALLTGKTEHAAWRSKPTYYAISTEDRTINPDLERFMAKRMGAKTIEVKAGHLSPAEITALILEAAGRQTGARYPCLRPPPWEIDRRQLLQAGGGSPRTPLSSQTTAKFHQAKDKLWERLHLDIPPPSPSRCRPTSSSAQRRS